jgi:hypothetical protein
VLPAVSYLHPSNLCPIPILEGDDFIPASRAEKGLGDLKTLAREGKYANTGGAAFQGATRNVNQGVAANIVGNCRRRSTRRWRGPPSLADRGCGIRR